MLEHDVDVQSAINIVTDMLADRVDDYANYKKQLPSFGAELDLELARYFKALEQYVQGTVIWYYESPRACSSVSLFRDHYSIVCRQGISEVWMYPTETWTSRSSRAQTYLRHRESFHPLQTTSGHRSRIFFQLCLFCSLHSSLHS